MNFDRQGGRIDADLQAIELQRPFLEHKGDHLSCLIRQRAAEVSILHFFYMTELNYMDNIYIFSLISFSVLFTLFPCVLKRKQKKANDTEILNFNEYRHI